jgi:hypothetical protein
MKGGTPRTLTPDEQETKDKINDAEKIMNTYLELKGVSHTVKLLNANCAKKTTIDINNNKMNITVGSDIDKVLEQSAIWLGHTLDTSHKEKWIKILEDVEQTKNEAIKKIKRADDVRNANKTAAPLARTPVEREKEEAEAEVEEAMKKVLNNVTNNTFKRGTDWDKNITTELIKTKDTVENLPLVVFFNSLLKVLLEDFKKRHWSGGIILGQGINRKQAVMEKLKSEYGTVSEFNTVFPSNTIIQLKATPPSVGGKKSRKRKRRATKLKRNKSKPRKSIRQKRRRKRTKKM